jgi:hypothetical protein
MLNRKLLIGLVAISFCSIAVANGGKGITHPQYCPKSTLLPVTVPTKHSGLFVNVEVPYLQPNNSQLVYGTIRPSLVDSESYSGDLIRLDPDFHFGFRVGLGYLFAGHGNDITATYTRLHTKDTENFVEPYPHGFVPSLILPFALSENLYPQITDAQAEFNYDALDLLTGQKIKVGKRLKMHLAAGLRLVKLENKFNVIYNDTEDTEPYQYDADFDSEYQGIGIHTGAKGYYHLRNGFGLTAAIGASLLVGHLKSYQQHQLISLPPLTRLSAASFNAKYSDRYHVVPELDAKIGFNYKYRAQKSGYFKVEGGWEITNYFNAHHVARYVDDVAEGVCTQHMSNISYQGPYLGLVIGM